MAIHIDDILTGFRQARMEVLIIEQEWSRFGWKTKDHIRALGRRAIFLPDHVYMRRFRLVNSSAIQLRIPFITRTLQPEEIHVIFRTFEHRGGVRVCACGFANVRCKRITDPRKWPAWVYWLRWQNFGVWHAIVVVVGISACSDSQLPEVVDADRVMRSCLCTTKCRQQHRGKNRDNCHHNQQLDQSKREQWLVK